MKIGQVLGKVFKGAAKALQDKDERPRRRSRGRKRSQPSPEAPRRADGPRFEYSPDLDGAPDPGEVVWAWVPYEDDPNQGKDRPVLLIGRHGSELLGVPMSSKDHDHRRDRHEWVDVGSGAWDSQGRPSEADANRVLRFREDEIRREGAILARDRFDEVVATVKELHGGRF